MEQPAGNGLPPNGAEVVGSPTDEPATKKARTEESASSGISHHIENWVNDLGGSAGAAASQAVQEQQGLPAPDGDRPYQDEVMQLLGGEKPEANTSQPFEYQTEIKRKLVIPGRRVSTTRRSISNPFLKSTSKLLESVTDLAEVLSHDDCMLLGRYFWVFTLEQLEFLLADNVDDVDIDEEAAKRVRDDFTARLKALLLGERPDRRGRLVSSSRSDYHINSNRMLVVDAEAIAAAAICGDDADEGLRKDIRTNVSSKAFPWLNSGAHDQTQIAADPLDIKLPPFNSPANLYAPTGSGNVFPPPRPSPYAAMDVVSTEQAPGGLMCSEDMGMKSGDPDVLPDTEPPESNPDTNEAEEDSKQKAPINIEDTLTQWKEAIRVYKENPSTVAPNKKFKIDGAIGVLIPGSTMNFLRSVEAETAWDFLSARRQENAPIGKLVREWRKLCIATEVVTQYAISKHLSGVALRMENALENIPPIELSCREWMSDPINGMAGAAREFLIYNQGIRSLGEFLSLKTKNLSIALEAWREKEGMERLKGSGKVAMISSWKAQSREMVEIEKFTGKVVDMSDCLSELKYKEKPGKSPAKSSVKKRKKSQPSLEYKPQVVLIDPEISKTLLEETLGKEIADSLKSQGISTPEEFLKADYTVENSQLYQALAGGGFVESEEFENKVQEFRESVTQAVQKRTRTMPDPDKAHASFNRGIKKRKSTDPFDALSATSQAFLATAGVTTAEQFLSTRSTELASKFGDWREEHGKPALKGCGNIASISGWKNLVRKRAADLGMTELQDLEPERIRRSSGPSAAKSSTPQARRPQVRKKTPKKYVEEPDEIDDVTVEDDSSDNEAGNESDPGDEPMEVRPRKPLKKPTYVVATVASDFLEKNKGPSLTNLTGKSLSDDGLELFAVDSQILSGQFLFDISKRGASNLSSFYLMFHGFNNGEVNFDTTSSFVTCRLDGLGDQDQQFEVLADVPLRLEKSSEDDFSGPFSTLSLGGGLLDVTRFVDRGSLPPQDMNYFKVVLEKFSSGEDVPGWPESESLSLSQNVIFQRTKANTSRALLYFDQPIQRGQTVPIQFPGLATLMSSKTFDGSQFEIYHLIEDSILSLCSSDLVSLGNWLSTNISDPAALVASKIGFEKACEQSVRFAWVGQRVASVLAQSEFQGSENLVTKLSFVNVINFARRLDSLSQAQQALYRTIVSNAVKKNLQYAVDLDEEMGYIRRRQWCTSAQELFSEAVDAFANFVVSQEETLVSSLTMTLYQKFSSQLDGMVSSSGDIVKLAVKPACTWTGIGKGVKKYVNIVGMDPEEGFVVCQDDAETKPVMMSAEEVVKGTATCEVSWYKKYYAEIICAVLDAFVSISNEFSLTPPTDAVQAKEMLKSEAGSKATAFNTKMISFEKFPLVLPKSKVGITPHSLPFFLSLVWPHLRNLGWSMVAGKTPSEIIYSSREQDNTTRLGFEQHLREQQREKQKKAVNRVGFGKLDKSTKRVISKVFVEAEKSDFEAISALTVKGVFDKYEDWLKNCSKVEGTDVEEYNQKVARIIAALDKLFESIAPLLSVRSNRVSSSGTSSRISEVYPSASISEFLLVAPNVIRQANLPQKSQVDSLSIIFELTKYYVSHHRELLKESCHLPREVYRREPSFDSPAFIGTRVNSMIQRDAKKRASTGDGDIELMPDSFRENLTDFILCVIDNAMPLRASEDDAERKKGRISAGSPGLACKHCKGARFEGRYFFSSVESLTSSYTVMEKHYLKCSSVPQKVKDELETARANHATQRKDIPVGSQQAYYRSLWDRLTGSGTPYNEMAGVLMSPDAKNVDADDANDVDDADSFDDHIKLIEHIKETVVDEKISEALKQYYSCLEYGGRVYMREDVMPEHFSANWLVSKMVPKDYSVNSYKKTFVG